MSFFFRGKVFSRSLFLFADTHSQICLKTHVLENNCCNIRSIQWPYSWIQINLEREETIAKNIEPISKAKLPSLQHRLMTKDGPREALQQLADMTHGMPQYWSYHDCSSTSQAAAASPDQAKAAAMQEQRRRMRG
jgi:hypothetical protein